MVRSLLFLNRRFPDSSTTPPSPSDGGSSSGDGQDLDLDLLSPTMSSTGRSHRYVSNSHRQHNIQHHTVPLMSAMIPVVNNPPYRTSTISSTPITPSSTPPTSIHDLVLFLGSQAGIRAAAVAAATAVGGVESLPSPSTSISPTLQQQLTINTDIIAHDSNHGEEQDDEPVDLSIKKAFSINSSSSSLSSSSSGPSSSFSATSPGSDNHICPDCGKRYSTSSNLARHRQTHRSVTDKKARKCPHCEKVYVSMPAFSMHVRTHSQGCQCRYCGKCFSRPWLLQGHIRTHTGEKPFKCHICTKAFADKSNLRAHVQTHSTSKPYVCERCGKAFALKSYLYKHEESSCMRLHHHLPRSNRVQSSRAATTAVSTTSEEDTNGVTIL